VPLNLLLAGATALLLTLAFPGFDLAFLAPIALAPLLVAVARTPAHARRFLLGWAAGVLYWGCVCHWIHFVLAVHGSMAEWAACLGFAFFCLVKGLHLGVFALLAGFLIARRSAALTVPALWVAIEWTHTHLGFAWLDLGNAGIDMSVPARLAPWTGVYGISFAFALAGTALALAVLRRPRLELAPLLALPLIVLLPALPPPQPGTETALLVQPNVSEKADWTFKWVLAMQDRLEALTMKAALADPAVPPRLIVWPEAPLPNYYYDDPDTRDWVDRVARRAGTYLIVNTTPRDATSALFNSALLVSPAGSVVGRYDQVNLVPFGEYVPWPFHTLVAKISTESDDFSPGQRQVTLAAGRRRIGLLICYESVFPDYVRRFARDGAEVLVNISNDGWYGGAAAREQHLKIVRMRAAENRRWLLRSTNDGITATIDPAGRLHRDLPPYTAAAARTAYFPIAATTFYSRHGDWFVLLCALLALAELARPLLVSRLCSSSTPPRLSDDSVGAGHPLERFGRVPSARKPSRPKLRRG
jgi:apolipoprotein N-acyltransferase